MVLSSQNNINAPVYSAAAALRSQNRYKKHWIHCQ